MKGFTRVILLIVFSSIYNDATSDAVSDWTKPATLDIPIQIDEDSESNIRNPIFGKGDVKLIIYMDFYCHICAKACKEAFKAFESAKNAQLILKPIGTLGSQSYEAARYAIAFNAQHKFSEFKDVMHKLYNHDKTMSEIPGLNLNQFQNDINSKDTLELLARNSLEVRKITDKDIAPVIVVMHKKYVTSHVGYLPAGRIIRMLTTASERDSN